MTVRAGDELGVFISARSTVYLNLVVSIQDRAKLDGSVPQPWVSYLSSARVFSDAPIDTA